MPDPITSPNSTSYDPAMVDANHCDATAACCAVTGAAPTDSARAVTPEPVRVASDAASGAKELVRRYDAGSSPSCFREQANAYVSCGLAASAAGGTIVSSPTGIGVVLGAITTAGLAFQCSRDVRTALDCNEVSARIAELDTECGSRNGVLLQGAGGNLVCLATK